MRLFLVLVTCSVMLQCREASNHSKFDLQGHRGCRGLYPENTIPAFLKAVDLGVNTLEMDLAVTADSQLLVSHEPYMSAEICLDSTGTEIADSAQYQYNIYQMTYEEIEQFDCGSKPHPRFPDQVKMTVSKPLFLSVIDVIQTQRPDARVNYNIEIKSRPDGDEVYHPSPQAFGDLVYQTIEGVIDWKYVTIQSFDFRVLQYFHETYPDVRLALLIENELPIQTNLDSLGFKPNIYSCWYKLLDEKAIGELQAQDIAVIPWTVNEPEDMKQLVDWGVDGLITDYPDRFNVY
ncbi:glycerophosphodiester phosphodiesterase family protein [Marinoscillum sp.]|uniref:glycerophosphodiester phosphodiesterase family protein n=1 Tax=Marinoscillum sp. TaxID=2024838 RepID=UPI003BAB2AF8